MASTAANKKKPNLAADSFFSVSSKDAPTSATHKEIPTVKQTNNTNTSTTKERSESSTSITAVAERMMESKKKLAAEEAGVPITPEKRKVGRPPKSTLPSPIRPPTEPVGVLKKKTPPPSPKRPSEAASDPKDQAAAIKDDGKKKILKTKIILYAKLYPRLISQGLVPPQSVLDIMSVEELQQRLDYLKSQSSGDGEYEYKFVRGCLSVLTDQFENICVLVASFVPAAQQQHPIVIALNQLGALPLGSFSAFIDARIEQGDSIDEDLREIAIDLVGWMPQSPYTRLAMKLAYAAYDFQQFASNQRLNDAKRVFEQAQFDEEKMARVREIYDNMAARRNGN